MRKAALIVAAFCFLVAPAAAQTPRELYQALNRVRVDSAQIYFVRDIHLRRDAVRVAFIEGKLALLTAVDGRVTGAVFTGSGRILAVPREPAERLSLARFLGEPLLDQSFTRIYLRFSDASADEIRDLLSQAAARNIQEPSFAADWDSTVANLNPWHSIRVLNDWLAERPVPYFYAGVLSEEHGAFDVLFDPRREDQIVIGQVHWMGGTRIYDTWASFSSTSAPKELPPVASPVRYAIDAHILADRSLEGRARLQLLANRQGERMVQLELSRNLRVEAVRDAADELLLFFQNEEVREEEMSRRGNDALFVVLPEALREGQEFQLEIAYRGNVISDAGNNVYLVGDRGSWYPQVGGVGHFVPFELFFRWPQRLNLVATGKKVEEGEDGEWRTGRWVTEGPVPVAGFNLGEYQSTAVEGDRWKIELYANRTLEEAILARFGRGTPPPPPPRPPLTPRRGTPPQVAPLQLPDPPPPSPAALMKQLGADIGEAIRFFEKYNGPFPFERLQVAQMPSSIGQSWPGLLYLSTLSFLTPEAQRRAGIGQRLQEHFTQLVPFHEVAHQWWGNVVGWSSYRDQWLQEGLTNYLALLYHENKNPNQNELQRWLETYRKELTTPDPQTQVVPEQEGPLVLGSRLRSSKSPAAYAQVIYGKGTWVFHMLRTMLRDPRAKDPDARFIQLLQSLLEKYRHRPLSTSDLASSVARVMTPAMDVEGTGKMDWFFEQWVYGTGIPRYSVQYTARPHPKGFLIRGTLKQADVPEFFIAPVPLYAGRATGRPVLLGTVVASGPETSFQFISATQPRRILIDPNNTLLRFTE